jgi:hypothetical protein
MPRGRTQEGYPCKYAPYYRGHYKDKDIPDTPEEKRRFMKRMGKTQRRNHKISNLDGRKSRTQG